MSVLFRFATAVSRIGLGPLVARTASLRYRGCSFSIDADGLWVNSQAEATFVSPSLHTKSFEAVKAWVLDNWTWGYRPGSGDTIIDVGSGTGEEAVIFSHLVGETGRVVAIEAHPRTFSALKETVRRSGLHNVTPVFCAVAERDGELRIGDGDAHLANSIIVQNSGISVPARSMDSLAAEFDIDEVALVKMNIEGAEALAVEGMRKLAPKIRNVVISCHDFIATEYGGSPSFKTRGHVQSVLEEQGFVVSSRPAGSTPWMRDYLYGSRENNNPGINRPENE